MPQTPDGVLRAYYAIAGLYTLSAALIWGVNTLFLLDAGLDIFGVFVANGAFTAGMVLFEIPTGVLADTRGRRLSFLLSVAILIGTTLAYVSVARAGGGLGAFMVVSVVMGLGFTFYSGATEAWLVDALDATHYEGELDRVFARGSMVTGAAMLVGTVSGGVLGSLDLSYPYLLRTGMLVAVFAVALVRMRDLGFTPRAVGWRALPREMNEVARASIRYGWRRRSVKLLMLCSAVQMGFMSWAFYAWQPYFLELLGRDAVWVAGVVAALVSGSIIVGNGITDWFVRFCGKRTTLLLWGAGVKTAAAVGVGFAGSFWLAVTLLLLVTGAMGVAGPVKQAYLHQVVPSEHRASVLSFNSLVGSAGGTVALGGLGYLGRAQSIGVGYVVGGLATLLALPLLRSLRGLAEEADTIVGARAGRRGACAAQGLPEVGLVDSTARRAVGE
ncbi:MAG: MFS transporter [Gemmatimonadetes bacterium]|nr:MFS transporter [Gemmatimonadota bacterium]